MFMDFMFELNWVVVEYDTLVLLILVVCLEIYFYSKIPYLKELVEAAKWIGAGMSQLRYQPCSLRQMFNFTSETDTIHQFIPYQVMDQSLNFDID